MFENVKPSVAFVGIVGVPAAYGGFETLVENLLKSPFFGNASKFNVIVYCSSLKCKEKIPTYFSASLRYIPLNPNGISSILYDLCGMLYSAYKKDDIIILLGVSAGIFIPIFRIFTKIKFIVNVDGVEWKRQKWGKFAKFFLKYSERIAIRFAHSVIADNVVIAFNLNKLISALPHVIAYGGDHVVGKGGDSAILKNYPRCYFFSVCRIEPENNIHLILSSFGQLPGHNLIIVGNWATSLYSKSLYQKYSAFKNIYLLDPIYDLSILQILRENAIAYVHGHSAGGTNPSLVEAMHSKLSVLAFDCDYNRSTTGNLALFFSSASVLTGLVLRVSNSEHKLRGSSLFEFAQSIYTWDRISKDYFNLVEFNLDDS